MKCNMTDVEAQQLARADKQRRQQLARETEQEDIRWLMSQEQGRRLMSRLISICGVYRSSFTGNSETFFREGQRNVGLVFIADAQSLAPNDFVKMLTEHGSAQAGSSDDRRSDREN